MLASGCGDPPQLIADVLFHLGLLTDRLLLQTSPPAPPGTGGVSMLRLEWLHRQARQPCRDTHRAEETGDKGNEEEARGTREKERD